MPAANAPVDARQAHASDEQAATDTPDRPAVRDSSPASSHPRQDLPADEPPLTEKEHANKTARRIREILKQVAAEEPTPAEKDLRDEIKANHELYSMLADDIADEQANPRRLGLLMPWEYRGRDFLSAIPGANTLKPPRPHYSLQFSAYLGNEQLASVERLIRHNSYALANLQAQRAWSKLSIAEQESCRRYQPEFAAEASGENAKKLEELTAQISRSPNDAQPHGERARLNWQRGDLATASADFRRAIQLSGENTDALRLQYAQLCEEQGYSSNAKTEYRQVAHGESPLRLEAYIRWGYVLLREGRTEPAMQAVKQALKLDDKCAAAHLLEAEVYKQVGLRLMVISSLESAVEAEPENAGMHYRLANVLAQLGRPDEALASYAKAIDLEPTWWRPRAGKASILHNRGDKEGALAELDEAIKWESEELSILESRVIVLEELGRTTEARKDRETIDRLSK